jgi:ankyrin repeat protein
VNKKKADIEKLNEVLKRINSLVDDFASAPAKSASDRGAYDDYPLHKVAIWGDIEAAEVLLDHGADVNALGEDDETALHRAVIGQKPDMVRLLLGRGANADIENRYGDSARDDALASGNPDLVAAMSRTTN